MALADQQMAERYGVSAATIALFRSEMTEGLHWSEASGQVKFTEAGRIELETLLDCKKKEGGGGEVSPQPENSTTKLLTVLKLYPNPTAVLVQTPQGQHVTVKIRPSKLMRVGARIQCRQDADGTWICSHFGLAPPH